MATQRFTFDELSGRHRHGYAYCSCGRPVRLSRAGDWVYVDRPGATRRPRLG